MDKPNKRGPGRPTKLTPELADQILTMYSSGLAISEICREAGMPDRVTLWRWRRENEEFATAFARAREANAETIEDEMLSIECKVLIGELDPQAANVVLSSQRWRARVLHPGRFGDKVAVDHSGSVGLSINIDLGGK